MARVTHAAPHLPIAEVKNRMRTDQSAMARQRWLIIYNALVEPRPAEEIARHCGVSKATVHAVISRYNRLGVAAIETKGQGGRRRQYLTLEEEKAFLACQDADFYPGASMHFALCWCIGKRATTYGDQSSRSQIDGHTAQFANAM